jgi:HEAT repeat protein
VIELAVYCDVQKAVLSLTHALEAGLGEVYALTQQLIALRAPQLLPALLERTERSAAEQLPRLADALMSAIASSSDAPALITVQREKLQRFADSSASGTQLHALLQVSDSASSVEHRRALAELWAKLPGLSADRERTEQLLRWLDDADPRVRDWSSVALGRTADNPALAALAERLTRGAAHPELSLQACAGAMLRASPSPEAIPSTLRERLLKQFQTYLTQPDETVAMSALYALRASHDQRSAHWIAGLLRGNSAPLRAAAVQALGDFDQPEARRMLRDMLRGDNLQSASNAALALAELGSDRDVEALLRAAERGRWPLPPSAAYAAARISQRGATRKHSLERVLCRFAQLRDSYVLTNSVSALAALGADACDEQINPRLLLEPALPSALRVAAALWLQSTRPHTPEENAERAALLARCAADHDRAVATACGPQPQTAAVPGQTLLRLSAPDGQSVLRGRMVALRMPDATVFIGQSDSAGRVLLPRVLSAAMQLEDPADQGMIALPARVSAPASP